MWGPSSRGFRWACVLPCCDVGLIKQRVPLDVFTTMLVMWDSSNIGRVYYHFVMWGPSSRGFRWACVLPCCDVAFIKQRAPLRPCCDVRFSEIYPTAGWVSLGVFTTMLRCGIHQSEFFPWARFIYSLQMRSLLSLLAAILTNANSAAKATATTTGALKP